MRYKIFYKCNLTGVKNVCFITIYDPDETIEDAVMEKYHYGSTEEFEILNFELANNDELFI